MDLELPKRIKWLFASLPSFPETRNKCLSHWGENAHSTCERDKNVRCKVNIPSVQFGYSVMSNSEIPWTTACQASLSITTPGVDSNSCPLSRWCHPTISSSVVPFSSCLQTFPASEPFAMSQLFASGAQSIGVSASTSVLPMNIQGWLPLGWTGWISLQSKGLSRIFSNTTVQKHQLFGAQLSL